MNRENSIEKHLLTRCYSSEERINELLSTRFSITGDQKPSLILTPTQAEETSQGMNLQNTQRAQTKNTLRKKNTRIELKEYFSQTMSRQRKLVKKLQNHKKTNTRASFPLDRYLKYYAIPLFEDFSDMTNLWQDYMQNLLFPNKNLPTSTTILSKLSSADLTGCLLTVSRSSNTTIVGTRGIVVWDASHSFILCVPRSEDAKEWSENKASFSPKESIGGFRIVPKKHSLFSFDVILPEQLNENGDDAVGFTLVGSRFEFKSADRSGKKFKNHGVDNII